MPKRKVEEFFKAYGTPGVSDAAVRRVVSKLRDEAATTRRPTFSERFANLQNALKKDESTGIYTLDLQFYVDTLSQKSERMAALFTRTIVAEQKSQGSVVACVYADEVVVGNIINPDNRRRSWCVYFIWRCLIPYRKDSLWMPLAVIRTDVVDQLEGGLPQAISVILRASLPFFKGGIVFGTDLVITSKLFFLADEDGLKKTCHHKGASGLRPCIRCSNCMSKGNSVDGFPSIEHDHFDDFVDANDQDIMETIKFLDHLEQTSTKKKLQEAEKLLGWKLSHFVFVWDQELWELLRPSRMIYDAMHCIWGNGIANLELGLFWQAATANGVQRSELQTFLEANWQQSMQIGNLNSVQLKSLAGPKVLKHDGSDFRGDASSTLQMVPLMTFFAQEMLRNIEGLRLNIKSLTALNRVCSKVLNAKIHPEDVAGLRALQEDHLTCFKECYSSDCCRPKHHYSCHLEPQVYETQTLMDTWPCERKHKLFKLDLAPRLKRLDDFERSILVRWVESDLNTLLDANFDAALLQPFKQQPVAGVKFGRSVQDCLSHRISIGNVLLFKTEDDYNACAVVLCFSREDRLGIIAQQMHLVESEGEMLWSKWTLLDEFVVMNVEEAAASTRTTFCSKGDSVTILLR